MALALSSGVERATKPKPLDRPVSGSRMILTSTTEPMVEKASVSSRSSAAHGSPPTNNLLPIATLVVLDRL